MSGRPEKPLDPSTGPVASFAATLRRLRQEMGGPTYRTMASRTHYSVPALSLAAGGTRFPSWACVEAYIHACGIREEGLVAHWKARWEAVDGLVRAEKRAARERAKARAQALAEAEVEANKLSMEAAAEVKATVVNRASLPVLDVRYVDADPTEVATMEEFLIALDQMRIEKGLSLRQIAERSRRTSLPSTEVLGHLSRSQLHDMLNGRAPLRNRHVLAYLLACGVPRDRASEWLAQLYKLNDQERRARAALTALRARPGETVTVITTPMRTNVRQMPTKIPQPAETPAQEVNARGGRHRRPNRWTGLLRRVLTGTSESEVLPA